MRDRSRDAVRRGEVAQHEESKKNPLLFLSSFSLYFFLSCFPCYYAIGLAWSSAAVGWYLGRKPCTVLIATRCRPLWLSIDELIYLVLIINHNPIQYPPNRNIELE